MPLNLTKIYNQHLELLHLAEYPRNVSLRAVFDRDITNNNAFFFRTKTIRPLKIEGQINMDTLFSHLTYQTEYETYEKGKTIKKRSIFDIERSKRLHWIWHHIQERSIANIDVFSFEDRIDGKNVIRTYIYDFVEHYVIILEPQRSGLDYYLLTAYYLSEKLGGIKQIEKKRKRRLTDIY
jgi:hypothetical protein